MHPPTNLHLDRARGLSLTWPDGTRSFYPIAYLRRMSPSADQKELVKQLAINPLTVLPASSGGEITALDAELVGNYAIRITFSDGHRTGLFSWRYLREIDPDRANPPSPVDADR